MPSAEDRAAVAHTPRLQAGAEPPVIRGLRLVVPVEPVVSVPGERPL